MILRIPMSDRFSAFAERRLSQRAAECPAGGRRIGLSIGPGAGHRKPRCSIRDGLPLLSFRTSSRIEERHESILSLRTGRTIKNGSLRSIPQYELAFER
jgi:hypothetical protein